MNLRWKASYSASCLHAAMALHEGLPAVDTELAAALAPVSEELFRCLDLCDFTSPRAYDLLVGLTGEIENNRQLVERLTKRVLGSKKVSETATTQLVGAIADLESTMLKTRPNLLEELEVRARPLREQWESRGPGLMRRVTQLTESSFLTSAAEIVLVNPLIGGHGRAHIPLNRVTFEAVLTNPHEDLPEALRLGWLLAQVNLDLPLYADLISSSSQQFQLSSLATLPLILSAAEHVEWAELNEASLARALECWHFSRELPEDTPARLLNWWDTYTSSNSSWGIAMASLIPLICE